MKHIYILLFCGIATLLSSCKKDNGNYDYQTAEEITVEGFDNKYTLISEKDRITLDPKVTCSDPNAELEYMWGIYETSVVGGVPVLDTIGRTKALDYPIKRPAKDWILVLRVTNKKTGYAKYVNSTLTVVTEFTRGWYVAKDDGVQTDLDLFLTPGSIIPQSKRENIFSLVNGGKINGKAKLLTYVHNYASTVTGALGNTKTLFVTTDRDVSAVYISTLKQIKNMDNLFLGNPPAKAPGAVFPGSSAIYLTNEAKLYALGTQSFNTGLFGAPKMKDPANPAYRLSDYFLHGPSVEPVFYDDLSSSFLTISTGTTPIMDAMTDEIKTAMPATNNNKKMLFMGHKLSVYLSTEYRNKTIGYAVFQDKTDAGLKILTKVEPNKAKMFLTNDTLKTTDKLYNASDYALVIADEEILYFITDNQVWSRNLSNKTEKLEFTPPSGEELTFIRHKKYTETNYGFNYIMIGTKLGDSYKVRMFNKASGSISGDPAFVLEGKGIVRDVTYISPTVGEFTYIHSY
ncbi:PKD-like family lipoprotein [Pedobacter nyackensis]|uniref:PKD-like family lipoprotein n=1 Tax=Pedobacter nyackensis TaxID=475255 RepID=UPI00293164D7|nr:PKD-like family lipoprotein [Pedobacter nyackensis]